MEVLRRKVAEEQAGLGQAKGELAAAKAARRHSESQARCRLDLDLDNHVPSTHHPSPVRRNIPGVHQLVTRCYARCRWIGCSAGCFGWAGIERLNTKTYYIPQFYIVPIDARDGAVFLLTRPGTLLGNP